MRYVVSPCVELLEVAELLAEGRFYFGELVSSNEQFGELWERVCKERARELIEAAILEEERAF